MPVAVHNEIQSLRSEANNDFPRPGEAAGNTEYEEPTSAPPTTTSSGFRPGHDGQVNSPAWDHVIRSKGSLLAGGVSGLVELSKAGYAIKSPWPGPENAECRREITLEARIYEILGPHDRLVKIQHWNPNECVLTMEYMPNGTLDDYLRNHRADGIAVEQRLRWALQTAQGLQLLHAADIVHCDLKAKNLLLDASLGLKIADFSGSSLRGSKTNSCAGMRYMPPKSFDDVRKHIDLFALGSVIYKIMSGMDPYEDIPSGSVWPLYELRQFPDVTGLVCGESIKGCWFGRVQSACQVCEALETHVARS